MGWAVSVTVLEEALTELRHFFMIHLSDKCVRAFGQQQQKNQMKAKQQQQQKNEEEERIDGARFYDLVLLSTVIVS